MLCAGNPGIILIDPKDRTLTQAEEMWTKYILPMGEGYFARKPFITLKEADYSRFDARYTVAANDEDAKRHVEWMEQIYGPQVADRKMVRNARLLAAFYEVLIPVPYSSISARVQSIGKDV